MNIINMKNIEVKDTVGIPMFTGGKVLASFILDKNNAKEINMGLVKFGPGGRTRLHTHSSEQVLIITEGKGIVATDNKEFVVEPGMIAYIPKGEKHWHGATKDSSLTHIVVLLADANGIIEEQIVEP
jgi:quercetin dioxygenase-like cupin family protein